MPYLPTQAFLAAAAALLLSAAPALAELDREVLLGERRACEQATEGKVADPDGICRCMAQGLSAALDGNSYAALSRLVNQGEETPEGLAARETARAVVQQCVAG